MHTEPDTPPKILILEDEAHALAVTELRCRTRGFEVVSASTGQHAIDAVRDSPSPFSAMVMDIRLNDEPIDGLHAVRTIQQDLDRAIPAVILSAYCMDQEFRQRAEEDRLNISGWVGKPDMDDKVMGLLHGLASNAEAVKSAVEDAFARFAASPADGIAALRAFLRREFDYDPRLVSYVLDRLEDDAPRPAAAFIRQVNFLTFEARAGLLLEKYGTACVAFHKGALVGYKDDEDELLREVYARIKTTDVFVAQLHPEAARFPAGPPVRVRRRDGLIR